MFEADLLSSSYSVTAFATPMVRTAVEVSASKKVCDSESVVNYYTSTEKTKDKNYYVAR